MARLAREAVHQAKTNTLGKPRAVDLAPAPVVAEGHWEMPVAIDPFETSPFEISDFLDSLIVYLIRTPKAKINSDACTTIVQERAFPPPRKLLHAAMLPHRGCILLRARARQTDSVARLEPDCLTAAGMGWALYTAERIRASGTTRCTGDRPRARGTEQDLLLPVKAVEVGRYQAVFDPLTVAGIVDETIGRATSSIARWGTRQMRAAPAI